jgi:uncharacterized damage-inducible protein DinB
VFAEYLRSHWTDVRAKLIALVDSLSDADLGFRPYDGAWTAGELVLHIAHEEYGEVGHGITRALPGCPDAFGAEASATVGSLKAQLAEVHAGTVRLLDSLDDAGLAREIETPWGAKATMLGLLGHVVEHETHHRAELSLILGMLGKPGLDA